MPDMFQAVGDPRSLERRNHPRHRVSYSCVQLRDDNGGIILDINECGMSLQAVRSLADEQSPHIRFQLSETQPWIETQGRIAWISASKKTAGVEFVELSHNARNQIKQWISSELQLHEPVEGTALGEKTEPMKDVPATYEPENEIRFPQSEATERVAEIPNPNSIPEDAVEISPTVERVLQYPGGKSTTSGFNRNTRGTTAPLLAWSELEARFEREIKARRRTSLFRRSGRLIGLTVGGVLLVTVLFFLGHHLPKSTHTQTQMEAIPSANVPEPSTDTSASPTISPADATPPSDRPGIMLQVGATTDKKSADALAELLQKRNFPAIVYFRGTDSFYRVVVGPYSDADSMLKVKEELKEQDIESFRMRRNPAAK